eukprot:5858783-Lingulodinium_polyedra.AAC.1
MGCACMCVRAKGQRAQALPSAGSALRRHRLVQALPSASTALCKHRFVQTLLCASAALRRL